ncbi:MAG: hypothetical protein M3Y58_16380 [Chloroflexota bacterium]|nr:hypothetical protein [Chloroflexota bacterium]
MKIARQHARIRTSVLFFDWSGLKVLLAALVILIALTSGAGPAQPTRAAGAVGIVVRHGDGRILYAYVPLTSDRMTGAEALQKSGLTLNVTAGGAYGTAVCAIDGEGCDAPKENCFCKSYGSPSFYWHYYARGPDGAWRTASIGAGNRVLHDGDVDGWSWTSGDSGLASVTPAQIAAAVQATPAPPTPLTPAPAMTDVPTAAPTQGASVATATVADQPRIAAIAPNGSATPINTAAQPASAPKERAIGGFLAVAAIMLALLALAPLGARRVRRRRDTNESS